VKANIEACINNSKKFMRKYKFKKMSLEDKITYLETPQGKRDFPFIINKTYLMYLKSLVQDKEKI